MNRLGPRRSGVLFATHAVFSTVLAWLKIRTGLSAESPYLRFLSRSNSFNSSHTVDMSVWD
jgi:hypothetical protein